MAAESAESAETKHRQRSRLKIPDNICRFDHRGHCRAGARCEKEHLALTCDVRGCSSQNCWETKRHPVQCKYFINRGSCRFGNNCSYKHEDVYASVQNLQSQVQSLSENIKLMTKQMGEFISTCGAAFATKNPPKPKVQNIPVKCSFCHKMYAGQRYLTRHMESKHKAKIINLDDTDEEKECTKAGKDMKSLEHVHMFDVHGPESTSDNTEDTDSGAESGADSGEASAEENKAKKGDINNDPNFGLNINYKLRSALIKYEDQLSNYEVQNKECGLSLIDIDKNSSHRGFSYGDVCFHFFTPSNPEETNSDEDYGNAGDPKEDEENETDAEKEQENDIGPDDVVATKADEAEDEDEETAEEDKNNEADADDVDAGDETNVKEEDYSEDNDNIDYIRLHRNNKGFGFSTMDHDGDSESPVVITRIEPGSPAAEKGLQPGDQIIAINGVYMCGFSDKNNASSQISYVVLKRALESGSATLTIKRKLRDEETYDALDNEEEEMQNYAVFGDPVPLPLDEDNTEEENDDENYYSSEE